VEVVEGLKVIKFSGLTDKTNWIEAAKIAKAMGFDDTAIWIRKNPELCKQLVAADYMKLQ
jgi:hypothetical protein